MALTLQERQEFLAQPHIGALAVAVGPDRAPLNVPIWYQYAPGGELWILTGVESVKLRRLRDAGRFSLMVQVVEPTVRYVTAEGSITRVEPMTDEMHREMATRYVPSDKVDAYLKSAEGFGDQVAVYMRPEKWLSADLGGYE
ncbi:MULTISPECIES: pyridoxamine 5'-phosphate oxidase family protein [unclassified Nocardia]|uniref:pyridoxamine 5'-phosphate oxidase family protein n=1 Tax=unclassified Nocardia TaxID=2637762 RepID=UPI00278C9029|nr:MULTISPECIES: pyridoxamine 5'-phosphate oxidase family protein [unclassified Nocardia]